MFFLQNQWTDTTSLGTVPTPPKEGAVSRPRPPVHSFPPARNRRFLGQFGDQVEPSPRPPDSDRTLGDSAGLECPGDFPPTREFLIPQLSPRPVMTITPVLLDTRSCKPTEQGKVTNNFPITRPPKSPFQSHPRVSSVTQCSTLDHLTEGFAVFRSGGNQIDTLFAAAHCINVHNV